MYYGKKPRRRKPRQTAPKPVDILHGETCELIRAKAVTRGYLSEWVLTLRYDNAEFDVKAFTEHASLFIRAGFSLPERWQPERDYIVPVLVVIEYDTVHQARRVTGVFNAKGELIRKEHLLSAKDAHQALIAANQRIAELEAKLAALQPIAIAN
jgi:hypothetical protein